MTQLSSIQTLNSCSVESLLSIPLQFIFRETMGSGNGRHGASSNSNHHRHHRSFIFSKNECATLLRVNMVSVLNRTTAYILLTFDVIVYSSLIFETANSYPPISMPCSS